MHRIVLFLIGLGVTGCATHRPSANVNTEMHSKVTAPSPRERGATRVVETRYELRAYRDPDDPAIVHDAHAISRATRVPAALADGNEVGALPRTSIPSVSYAPLPPNAELSAEIATQKQITADLRAIQTTMAATQRQAQSQYGTLMSATAQTMQLQQQLEAERARVKELQAKLSEQAADATPAVSTTTAAQTKW